MSVISEADFWEHLEFRVCRELEGMIERELRGLWCDGLVPEVYLLDTAEPRITGRVWICRGSDQSVWNFTLFLDRAYDSIAAIDRLLLLPDEEQTDWLAIDSQRKLIEIDQFEPVTGHEIN